MHKKSRYYFIGISSAIALFLLFGTVTAIIPNPWFRRMTGITVLDYFFLAASSILLGSYMAVNQYKKRTINRCDIATYSGGAGSFLSFACPICNKILVLLFGATALMAYLEPYQPIIGFFSIAVLAGALYFSVREIGDDRKIY